MSSRGLVKQIKQHPIYFDGDDFSEVSEEKISQAQQEEEEEKEQEQLEWRSFHKEKLELEKLKKQLFAELVHYRKNLTEALKDYCLETDNRVFNYQAYIEEQETAEKKNQEIQNLKEHQEEDIEEKTSMLQKLLEERRIKRYYKNKYEINVQDQLDPEDDQRQIYQYYEEIFGGNQGQHALSSILAPQHLPNTQVHPPIHTAEYSIMSSSINEPRTFFQTEKAGPKLQASINKQHYKTDPSKQSESSPKLKENLFTAGHELSFDPKNDNNFGSNKMGDIDSFALHEDHNDVMSEGGLKARPHKEEDQMSHKDNIYKNFISKQNQQLMQQRMKVKELTAKAMKVLNNDEVDQDELHGVDEHHEHEQHEDYLSTFKYYFGELVQIFTVSECLKFILKFKSFQLINKLFQNASTYYEEEILFEEPLTVKHMSQIIAAALPEESEETVRVVIENIFGKESEITYEQFLEKMTPSINDHQFNMLQETLVDTSTTTVFQLTVGLFGLWIEYQYFEKSLKELLQSHPVITERFLSIVSEEGAIIIPFVTDFLVKSKKSKEKKLKVEVFLRKILGDNMKSSEFYKWVESRKIPVNQSFEKLKEIEKLEYFYNLY